MKASWHVPVRLAAMILCAAMPLAAAALEIGDREVAPGTRVDLQLSVPAGEDDPATSIPVTVLNGAAPGPVFLMVAGVHGYEFNSILAAEQLAELVDPAVLSGALLLVRPAHVAAFEARSPYVNPYDRKNLNRSFPGTAAGTQTERIAHALSTELIAKADFVADVHSGDGAEWLEAFVGVYGGPLASDYESALAVAKAVGFPNIVRYRMNTQEQIDRGRSLNRQAVAQGLPTVLIEIGENGSRRSEHVAAIVDGIQAALGTLGMLPGGPERQVPAPRYFDGTESVPVEHSGIWHPRQAVGRPVQAGEVLGVIRDYAGAVVETVRAPVAGRAIYGLAGPPIRAGDSVMSIALPVEALD